MFYRRPIERNAVPESPLSDDVREFFDRQQQTSQYESLKSMTKELDQEAARLLNAGVKGDALSIGGIWDFFVWSDELKSLTVLDLSPEMLKGYCPEGATGIVGDIYDHDFGSQRFDTITFTLMLHHTPKGNWRACEARVVEAVAKARQWLRPGGRVFILEYCPTPTLQAVQHAALPVTRRFLSRFHQPLVVMYSRAFYYRVMSDAFGSCEARPVDPEGFNYWKWYPVFMSIRWLRVPLAVYPKLHLFSAPAVGSVTGQDSRP
jgi:SAM-dependent methyltransferase